MARRSRRGRPPLLLTALQAPAHDVQLGEGATVLDVFLRHVRNGVSPPTAAVAVGVSRSTYFRWVQDSRGRQAPAYLREFQHQVEMARAQYVGRLSAAVTASIPSHPALGIKLLRRVDPDGQWDIDAAPPAKPPQPVEPRRDDVIVLRAESLPEPYRSQLLPMTGRDPTAVGAGSSNSEESRKSR